MYGNHSDLTRSRPYAIKRLGILLYALGFASDDPLIADLIRSDARFEYPPKNGLSYNRIRENLQILRERKLGKLLLNGGLARLQSPQRAEIVRVIDDLMQRRSYS